MRKLLPLFAVLAFSCGTPTSEPDAGTQPRCGNGILEAGEACDDGNTSNIDGCTNTCALPSCGNGVVDPGEQCDDGNTSNIDACTRVCLNNICGDRFIYDGVEVCDDGNSSNNDNCRNDCSLPVCGDGNLQPGEACDDGNSDNADGCSNTCRLSSCGDGILQANEACDDGNASNTDGCTNACALARCGDGFAQAGVEQCDDANSSNSDACTNTCQLAVCGDGFQQPGEECDDGNPDNSDPCTTACKVASCGDGFLQSNEQCDDGNTDGSDDCTPLCTVAECGDGFLHATNEECDDGNPSDSDACLHTCVAASCGDGFVNANVEECDDANSVDLDACRNSCEAARCGDGVVHVGVEDCDPQATSPATCDPDCTPVACGDGLVNQDAQESCDDQNSNNSDGCNSLCVAQPNTLPVANDEALFTDEDTSVAITLTGQDPDGETVSFTLVTPPQNGQLTGTGANHTYVPNTDFHGTDSFTFTVNDGFADGAPATVSVTVQPVNDEPLADDLLPTVDEDGSVEITLTATDADGDSLSFSIARQPSHGTLSAVVNGKVTYTPGPDFNGSDLFEFKANDGTVDSLEGAVAITVTPVNDAPTATDQSIDVELDAATALTLAGTDVDGDPLSYTVVTQPEHGTLSGSGASLTYTPTSGYTGPDSFTFKVNDGTTDSAVATVSLDVKAVTCAPGTVSGPGFSYSLAVSPDGSLVYVAGISGTLDIIDTASQTVTQSIPNLGVIYGFSLSPDGTRGYISRTQVDLVSVVDTRTNTLVADIAVPAPYGSVVSADGSRLYVASGLGNSVSVIRTTDNTVLATITGTVTPFNVPNKLALSPDGTKLYVTSNGQSSNPGTTVSVIDTIHNTVLADITGFARPYDIVATATHLYVTCMDNTVSIVDVDPSSATYNTIVSTLTSLSNPFGVALTPDGTQVWVTDPGSSGSAIKVIDTSTNTLSSATITGVGAFPTFVAFSANGKHGAVVSWDNTTNLICYPPPPPPLNQAPVVSGPVSGSVSEDGAPSTLDALANASDADTGDVLSVVNIQAVLPAGVTYDSGTKSFTLDPADAAFQSLAVGATTTVSVNFDVSDGKDVTPAVVGWTLTGINDAPSVSGAVTGNATEDGATVSLDALANASDVDFGDTLSVTPLLISLPAGVSFDAPSHTFSLDPTNAAFQSLAAGATTTVTVSFDVTDGTSTTAASVSWTVTGVNDAPVVSGPVSGTATEDGSTSSLNALSNASDADTGDVLSVVNMQAVLPAGVTYDSGAKSFTLDPTNVAFQSLASGATTTVTVNFDVTDGTSTTAASVSWTVTGVNDAPSLSPTAGAPDVSTGVVTGASGGTDDDAGDVLAFSVASNPSKGSVTLDPNTGAFTYTPTASARHAAAADGASTADLTDSFTVSVSDGHGGSTQAQVTVAIGPANAAPMLSPTVGTPDASTGVVTGTSGGTDADGDTLTFSVTSTPSMGTVLVDPNTGAFTYTPDAAARATAGPGTTDSFGLFVNDGHGGTALTSVTVIVAPLVASCSSATISVGMGPVGIAITPDGTRVYVSNFDDDTVSVIDTTTTPNTVVATIPVGDEPIDVAITPNGSWAYVTNSADNTVSVINTADYSVLSPISVGTSPYGVAIRPNGSEAYVVNSFSGTVSVIDTTAPNTGNPTISVGNGPFMLAISPDGTRVYVSNFDDSTLSVIDTTTTPKTVIDTISLGFGSGPYGIAFSPGGALAYVLAHLGNSMSVINTAQNSVTSTTFGLNYPYDIAITPDGTRAYVTNQGNDTVSVIDTTTNPNTVIDTISGFNTPYEIAITPDGTRAYVANRLGSSVSVICIPQGGNPN